MKGLIAKYSFVLRFVSIFLICYLVLTTCYSFYLNSSTNWSYFPDFVTYLVAKQSAAIILGFGYDIEVIAASSIPEIGLYLNDSNLANIVEGCNSISIIILFLAFIFAFAQNLKRTLLFALAGSVLIYGINLIRIVVFVIALYHYPQYEKILHGVVFPAFIYGTVFLLWMFWVRRITPINNKKNE